MNEFLYRIDFRQRQIDRFCGLLIKIDFRSAMKKSISFDQRQILADQQLNASPNYLFLHEGRVRIFLVLYARLLMREHIDVCFDLCRSAVG